MTQVGHFPGLTAHTNPCMFSLAASGTPLRGSLFFWGRAASPFKPGLRPCLPAGQAACKICQPVSKGSPSSTLKLPPPPS